MLPERRMINATPRLAPELIPNSDGPAKGLRNTVCICSPLMDSPAPATKAVMVCGKRDFQMIFCQISVSSPSPHKIFQTEENGMEIVPSTKFRIKNRMTDKKIRIKESV